MCVLYLHLSLGSFLKKQNDQFQVCTTLKKTSTLACKVKLVLHDGGPEESSQKPAASEHSLASPVPKTEVRKQVVVCKYILSL